MATTVANLVQGPATLYLGAYGATEPADNAVGTAPSSAVWTDVGGTVDGAQITIKQEYKELEVDQVVDIPGRRLTKRDMVVKTKLAEPTFANLVYALNDGTTATGTGYQNFTPAFTDSATQPTYRALIVWGWAAAPGAGGQSFRRSLILRRVLSSDDVEISYMKDKQTLLTVQWSVHYVSGSISPFKIVDQTS